MKLFPFALAGLMLVLPSCESLMSEEYTPEYLKETSPLDPPGTEAARKAMRAERVKEGKYETGSTIPVQQGRVFLLSRNPEYSPEPSGRMVESDEAKILSCEGLYYFVEMADGKRGYLRETDFEQPVELMPTDPMMVGGMFLPEGGEVEGAAPMQLDDNQTLTTNEDGRAVVLVGKKSDRSAEFEQRRQAVEKGGPIPLPAPAPAGEEPPPLPEPAGDGPQ